MQIYNTWNTEEDVEHTVGDKEDGDDKEANNTAEKKYNFQSLNPSLKRNFLKQYSPQLIIKRSLKIVKSTHSILGL